MDSEKSLDCVGENALIKVEDLDNVSDLGSDDDLYTIDNESHTEEPSKNDAAANDSSGNVSDSSSSSSSDDSSDDSSDYDDDDNEDDGEDDYDDQDVLIKSKNEILNEPVKDISDIREIEIDPKAQKNMKLGKIYKKISSMKKIIVESDISGNEYIIDTSKAILFKLDDENKAHVVGYISEIFGPTNHPYYTISFDQKTADLFNSLELGEPIYVLIDDNFKLIKTSNIKMLKGSDASNFNDEEVDEKDMEFSDDEEEQEWKKQQKLKRTKKDKQNELSNGKVDKLQNGYVSRGERKGNKNRTENSLIDANNVKGMDVNILKVILGPAVLTKEKPVTKTKPTPNTQNEQQTSFQPPPNNLQPPPNNLQPPPNNLQPPPNNYQMHQQSFATHHAYNMAPPLPHQNNFNEQPLSSVQPMMPQQYQQFNGMQYGFPQQQQPYGSMPPIYHQQNYPYYGLPQANDQNQLYNQQQQYYQQQMPQQNNPIPVEQQQLLSQLNQLSPDQLKELLEKATQNQSAGASQDPNVKIRKWNQK